METEIMNYELRLYIAGKTAKSVSALANLKKYCEEHLKGHYRLEIIDVYQQADIAKKEQLVALPMLLKKQPLPEKRMIGDLSDTNKVLTTLNLIK